MTVYFCHFLFIKQNLGIPPHPRNKISLYSCASKQDKMAGWSPLHVACVHGSVATVETLVQAGADIKALDYLGDTPANMIDVAWRSRRYR
jgi:hypothetical protein